MSRATFALVGLADPDRPVVLMLLDDEREANEIAFELRRGGANVVIRPLPTDEAS